MVTLSLVPHQKSTASCLDQQKQTQGQPTSPQFEFINTTTNVQYSGIGSRSVARSHVMRNFHRKKGKSRLQQANLHGPRTSQSLLPTAQVQGQSGPNRSLSGLIGAEDTRLNRLDENAMHGLTHSDKAGSSDNKSALWLRPRHQERDKEHRKLPISNLWALSVDAHAAELIYHCKPHLFHICSGQFLPIHWSFHSHHPIIP